MLSPQKNHTLLRIKDALWVIVTLCGYFDISHRPSTIFSAVSETVK